MEVHGSKHNEHAKSRIIRNPSAFAEARSAHGPDIATRRDKEPLAQCAIESARRVPAAEV
eukprot:4209558-Alexandrium_andersonii.AAC.1